MSKPQEQISTINKLPTIIGTPEDERMEYLAMLLLEMMDEELLASGVDPCIPN